MRVVFGECEIHSAQCLFSRSFCSVDLQVALPRLGLMVLAYSDGLICILR